MEPERLELEIPSLRTVSDYRQQLIFLENGLNRTQIRNACQLLQLRQFMIYLANAYTINRGLGRVFLYNILRLEADICEGLLYSLQVKYLDQKPKNKVSLEPLINFAKTIHEPRPLLSRETKKELERLLIIRNNLHPTDQAELHTNLMQIHCADEDSRRRILNVHRNLIDDIKRYYDA